MYCTADINSRSKESSCHNYCFQESQFRIHTKTGTRKKGDNNGMINRGEWQTNVDDRLQLNGYEPWDAPNLRDRIPFLLLLLQWRVSPHLVLAPSVVPLQISQCTASFLLMSSHLRRGLPTSVLPWNVQFSAFLSSNTHSDMAVLL